jgi:predicted transcriptional regulator
MVRSVTVSVRVPSDIRKRLENHAMDVGTTLTPFLREEMVKIASRSSPSSVVITVELPRHLVDRLDDLARRLQITREQVLMSTIGASSAKEYPNQLAKVARDLECAKKGSP